MLTDNELKLLIAVLSDNLDDDGHPEPDPQYPDTERETFEFSLSNRGGIELPKYPSLLRADKVLQ
jgi:hypothetical protein